MPSKYKFGYAKLCTSTTQQVIRKRVPLENGAGFTTIRDGTETVTVAVYVDAEAIAQWMAHKAARSKAGVSRAINGAVQVRVLERKRNA